MTTDYSRVQCPTCGYYCLGSGGMGCIDKPSLVAGARRPDTLQSVYIAVDDDLNTWVGVTLPVLLDRLEADTGAQRLSQRTTNRTDRNGFVCQWVTEWFDPATERTMNIYINKEEIIK